MNTWRQASEYLRVRRAERESLRWISIEQQKLLKLCAGKIAAQEDEIAELHQAVLGWQQSALGIAEAWRKTVDEPDVDVSEDLEAMICELRDQVGLLGEFVT